MLPNKNSQKAGTSPRSGLSQLAWPRCLGSGIGGPELDSGHPMLPWRGRGAYKVPQHVQLVLCIHFVEIGLWSFEL